MKYFSIILILLISHLGISQSQLADQYINRYKDIAINEMQRTGIPASITLAQGLLESDWGRSELAVKSNNHFGIKCSGEWKGENHFRYDDEYDRFGKKKKSCFRVYEHAEASFMDHSEFLTDPNKSKRYGFLFGFGSEDYVSWAHGLRKAGYATDPKYGNKLIQIIEKYQLHQYDTEKTEEIYAVHNNTENYSVQYINSCKVVIAKGGENLKQLSKHIGVSSRNLLKYNDQITKREESLARGERVYLEPRKNYYLGEETIHKLKPGQDLAYISTLYGIDLEYIKDINGIETSGDLANIEELKLSRSINSGNSIKYSKSKKHKEPIREILAEHSEYLFDHALTPVKN